MAKTNKFNAMIEAFECDFTLAKNRLQSLGSLDISIIDKDEKLMKDINLLEELSFLLRNGKAEIHLIEETKTRGDKIRHMTDEELAELFYKTNHSYDKNGKHFIYLDDPWLFANKEDVLEWLQSEAEGE